MGRPHDQKPVDAFTPAGDGQRFDRLFHGHVVPAYDPKERNPSYLARNVKPAPENGGNL